MRDAVAKSVAAMKWVEDSDAAAVAQAEVLAEQVDILGHLGETTKALSAHRALTAILNDLGATPTVRMANELRSLRGKTGSPEVPDDGDDASAGSNVSKFERPAKRNAG